METRVNNAEELRRVLYRPIPSIAGPALDHVHDVGQELVLDRDHARVGLEAALGLDQMHELRGRVHVRGLERAGEHLARARALARAEDARARVGRGAEVAVAELLEARLVREG